jgi:hypothetical protein
LPRATAAGSGTFGLGGGSVHEPGLDAGDRGVVDGLRCTRHRGPQTIPLVERGVVAVPVELHVLARRCLKIEEIRSADLLRLTERRKEDFIWTSL